MTYVNLYKTKLSILISYINKIAASYFLFKWTYLFICSRTIGKSGLWQNFLCQFHRFAWLELIWIHPCYLRIVVKMLLHVKIVTSNLLHFMNCENWCFVPFKLIAAVVILLFGIKGIKNFRYLSESRHWRLDDSISTQDILQLITYPHIWIVLENRIVKFFPVAIHSNLCKLS